MKKSPSLSWWFSVTPVWPRGSARPKGICMHSVSQLRSGLEITESQRIRHGSPAWLSGGDQSPQAKPRQGSGHAKKTEADADGAVKRSHGSRITTCIGRGLEHQLWCELALAPVRPASTWRHVRLPSVADTPYCQRAEAWWVVKSMPSL